MEDKDHDQTTETGLSDELVSEIQYVYATTGQRFLNFFIDFLLLRFGLSLLTGIGVLIIIGSINPEFVQDLIDNPRGMKTFIVEYLIGIVNFLLYYTICEKAFRGYTLGKLISGTRAIRTDGGELTLKDAFLRSLSRIVPFEALSGFSGHPWHDTWTNTMVVKAR